MADSPQLKVVVFDHFGESQTFPPRLFYRSKNGEKKGNAFP